VSGVGGLAKGLTSIARVNQAIARLATVEVQTECATDVAAVLDTLVKGEFAAGQTVYDTARPLGVEGNKLLLLGRTYIHYASQDGSHKSRGLLSKTRRSPGSGKKKSANHAASVVGFKSVGTIVRASFPTNYTKYLVGKYRILPMKLPPLWKPRIAKVIHKRLAARMVAAGATAVAA
jgi:hypothetical protein